jgi:hypothetical protein
MSAFEVPFRARLAARLRPWRTRTDRKLDDVSVRLGHVETCVDQLDDDLAEALGRIHVLELRCERLTAIVALLCAATPDAADLAAGISCVDQYGYRTANWAALKQHGLVSCDELGEPTNSPTELGRLAASVHAHITDH